ncbi:hypothetical protein CDL12_18597 [Handroanthus impetiginosus]|uniref:EF-hand domain-containing protein n=1 Tax=Handroanthus impetiginosus TaxID=429701 RepID=A0A2G9GU62_9LAMI|nr:hypothetical protein CDL12_18597 [Handroanthus impetiginosus]
MSQDYVNQLQIENISLNSIQMIILIVGLVEFLLLQFFTDRKRIYNFFLGFQSLISSNDSNNEARMKERDFEPSKTQEKRDDRSMSKGDMEIVLRSLGMFGEGKLPEKMDVDDLSELFEEKNPNLDEAKEAFDVFDDNKDGFIDAKELQKVLCALGLKEGLDIDNCRRMIGVFDENEDGRIDFDEFVKFMEISLC